MSFFGPLAAIAFSLVDGHASLGGLADRDYTRHRRGETHEPWGTEPIGVG